jgi:hypothetical protein
VAGETGVQIVRGLIRDFSNAHDPPVAARYFTPDFRWHGGSVGEYEDIESYAKAMSGFWSTLPDAHATELDAFEAADRVTMRFVIARATARSPSNGQQKTGAQSCATSASLFRRSGIQRAVDNCGNLAPGKLSGVRPSAFLRSFFDAS